MSKIRLYPFKVLCILLPYEAFYSKLPGSRRLISVRRTMSRKKIILSAREASNVFLPFPSLSPSSTIPCCSFCLHCPVWCSNPSAKCWTSSGKLWLRHLPLLPQLLESRFQLRTPTDTLCQVCQGLLKGLASPAALLCLSVSSYTSVAKPCGVPV